MPDDPTPPASELDGLDPGELLARGLKTVRTTRGGRTWTPPTPDELAAALPRYRIEALIGQGGMGAVYRAVQTGLERTVAIKLLPLDISTDRDFAGRFLREARTLARLNHPNIVGVYDSGTTPEGHLYFVMEFVEGTDLHRMIHGPGLTPAQTLEITIGVCEALQYAHGKGVVHRDIKPANVMVSSEGQVKVADFGLARLNAPDAQSPGTTVTGTVMGTPDYMAPEQTRGLHVDHRADIYSLGVMLYEMLCGEVPRGIFDPPSRKVQVDVRLDEVVVKAMQQEPDRRYQHTREMKTDVDAIRATTGGIPAGGTRSVVSQTSAGEGGRKTSRTAAVIAACLVLGSGAGFFILAKVNGFRASRPQAESSPALQREATADGLKPSATLPVAPPAAPTPVTQAREIDLLALVDVKRDAISGDWAISPQGLLSTATYGTAVVERTPRLQLPYVPPEEYDFEIQFTPRKSGGWIAQHLTSSMHPFQWRFDEGSIVGFLELKAQHVTIGETGNALPSKLMTDQRYRSTVEVRRESVRGLLDGKELVKWSGGIRRLGTTAALGDNLHLGLSTATNRSVFFHKIVVREVTGTGKVTLDATGGAADSRLPHPPLAPEERNDGAGGSNTRIAANSPRVTPPPAPGHPGVSPSEEPAAPSVTAGAATKDEPFVNTLGMKFVLVPITGGPTGGQRVLFSIWETRVQDYRSFADETKREWPKPAFPQAETHPAVNVRWDDANAFCTWLSERERKLGKLGASEGYRLPTDHEWSCAVGIGDREDPAETPADKSARLPGVYPWGATWPPPSGAGNYFGEEQPPEYLNSARPPLAGYRDDFPQTAPVGSFPANALGLHDLGGNVWEWCEDLSRPGKTIRAQRGGSWGYGVRDFFLSSFRFPSKGERGLPLGFRVVLAASPSEPVAKGN